MLHIDWLIDIYKNIFSLSENIVKSFRGGYFFDSHYMLECILLHYLLIK